MLPFFLRAFDCTLAQREDRSCLPHLRAGHSLLVSNTTTKASKPHTDYACCLGAFDCTHAQREDRRCLPHLRTGHSLQVQQHYHQGEQAAHRLCLLPLRLRLHPCAARKSEPPAPLEGRTLAASPAAQPPRPANRTQTMLAALAPLTASMRSAKTGAVCFTGGQDTRC